MNFDRSPAVCPVPDRLNWWTHARFGISFHWGLYALAGRGEWVRSVEQMPIEHYQNHFDRFGPDLYSPREWARLAKAAGMGYAILTTKHHDGFCLFDSALTNYKSTNTPAKRDLVRDYVDAFRAEGLRVGLYYSLVDWHHPDYPSFGDRHHPMRANPDFRRQSRNWSNYVNYFHGQVHELLTNYGKIDLLVFDFSYAYHTGAKWGAEPLIKDIRRLQPDIVLNDRLSSAEAGNIKSDPKPPWVGDFDTCELNTPHGPTIDARGRILPWELWITHNNAWCYNSTDSAFKTPQSIIRALVNCVSKSGNLTLNFGPDARGRLPVESVELLHQLATWTSVNRESYVGCGLAPIERPDWGRWTLSNDCRTLYAHITEQPMGHLTLRGLRGKVTNARVLATGSDAALTDFWNPGVQSFGEPDDFFLNIARPAMHTYVMPDQTDTVVALDIL